MVDEILDLCRQALSDLPPGEEDQDDDEDLNVLLDDSASIESRTDAALRACSHFPTPETADLLRMRASRRLKEGKPFEAALASLQAQGLLLRHQVSNA